LISQGQKVGLRRQLAGFLSEAVPLAPKTTFKVGGSAAFYLEPKSLSDLELTLKTLAELDLEFLLIGGGSNVLVTSEGVQDRVVISLEHGFKGVEIVGTDSWSVLFRVESGVLLSRLVRMSADEGCSGFEKLAAIPGSVGGALAMNAGAFGSTIYDSLAALQIMEKGILNWQIRSVLNPTYRDGGLTPGQVVVAAYFLLERKNRAEIAAEIAEIKQLRRQRLPSGDHAGSVFKNPAGDFAGRLLDESGCKGLRCGGAYVSEKHANVIVAERVAQADDILTLMKNMRTLVRDRCGVSLESEIRIFS